MAVTDTESRIQYAPSPGTTILAWPFKIFATSDIDVYKNGMLLTELLDYTVSGVGEGGTITLDTPTVSGDLFVLQRSVPQTQSEDFITGGEFTSTAIVNSLDRLTVLIQQAESLISDLGVTYAVTSNVQAKDKTLPILSASQYWQMNDTNTGIAAVSNVEESGCSTLRSELASPTSGADGARMVGYYSATNGETTVKNELDSLYTLISYSITTGIILPTFTMAAPTGWLILNGETIGSTSSGADHAGLDYQDLFEHLWNNTPDSSCAVSSGRGASATADFIANKTLTIPDARDRTMRGNNAGNLAAAGGADSVTLSKANIPPHVHTYNVATGLLPQDGWDTSCLTSLTSANTGDGSADGLAGDAFSIVPKNLLVNWMIKL